MPRITVTIHYEKYKPALHPDPNAEAILVRDVLVDGHQVLFERKHGEDRWSIFEATDHCLEVVLGPRACPTCGNKPQ